ncbi:DUF6343 family protein [Streptomyces sp. NPDC046805]|uniref:DUF6343 family protein n=1 Tax=Streptomyces sp. NPDC046805 TaxID=3155134 RepID=UPI0033C18092
MSRRRSPDISIGVPRSPSDVVGHRRERMDRDGTNSEPVTARGPLDLRIVLGLVGLLVFLLGTALFALWARSSAAHATPSSSEIGALAALCGVLSLLAFEDLVLMVSRRARERCRRRREE